MIFKKECEVMKEYNIDPRKIWVRAADGASGY